jgi:YVTN family beta-propeller protein
VIDSRTNQTIRTLPAGHVPASLAITPDGGSLYVANELAQSVSIIDTRAGTVISTVPVGVGPFGADLSPSGNNAYIADLGPGNLSVLDTHTHQVTTTVSLGTEGTDPFSVAATATAIYVADQGANALAVIDPHAQGPHDHPRRQQPVRRGSSVRISRRPDRPVGGLPFVIGFD